MATLALYKTALVIILQQPWINPIKETSLFLVKGDPLVPGLPIYQDYTYLYYPYII